MRNYLFTLKPDNFNFISQKELISIFNSIVQLGFVPKSEWSYPRVEIDSLGRLHIHTIVCTANNISSKKISKSIKDTFDLYAHFKPFPFCDFEKVQQYINKDVKEAVFAEEYSYQQLFIRNLPRIV